MVLTLDYDGALLASETWDFGGGATGKVRTAYSADEWPTNVVVWGTSGPGSVVTYSYDADGLVTSAAVSGGVSLLVRSDATTALLDSTRASGLAVRYGHNPYAELTSTAAWYGADTLFAAEYTRDALGRISRIVERLPGGTTDRGYTYDDRGRLTGVRDLLANMDLARYGYDRNGNRIGLLTATDSITAAYDAQDRLIDRGAMHYGYTANGERTTATGPGGTTTTTYDLLGNLLEVETAGGDTLGYTIDGRNRRVERRLNGVLTGRWVYANDLAVIGELDSAGALRKRFVHATRDHDPDLLVVRNASGPDSTYGLVTDQLGSVRAVVNVNTGFVAQRLDYDAWGVVTLDTNPGFQPFGFAGGLYDPASGLVRFGVRDYDPQGGVWTSKDPSVATLKTTNLYSYAYSDPLNAADHDGRMPVGPGVADSKGPDDGGVTLNPLEQVLAATPAVPSGIVNAGAGFGDAVTFGVSRLVRQLEGIESTVEECSAAYRGGATVGWMVDLSLTAAGWAKSLGVGARVAIHGPHHEFGVLGRLSHVQLNTWEKGVRGSGGVLRIPLPWR